MFLTIHREAVVDVKEPIQKFPLQDTVGESERSEPPVESAHGGQRPFDGQASVDDSDAPGIPLNRRIVPNWIRAIAARLLVDPKYRGLSLSETFSRVYRDAAWGKNPHFQYYSGDGSHDPRMVDPYISAVTHLLNGLEDGLIVVDIGCGDFNIGRQLRPFCSKYVACDVVPDLIRFHKLQAYAETVEFRVLDITTDDPPSGDVVVVRQVLQHLSNDQILMALPRFARFKHWIVTEHLPMDPDFIPNQDKPAGHGIRLGRANSGVVLSAPPFNIRPKREDVLCEQPEDGGIVRTIHYSM